MVDLMDAINLYLASKSQYYTLWTFYFTASAGIIGFVYGNSFARKSNLAKAIACILYIIVVSGNSQAIISKQNVINQTTIQINNVLAANIDSEKSDDFIKVNVKPVFSEVQETPINDVKWYYWVGTLLVFVGIWFLNIIRFVSYYNARWNKRNA